MLASFVIPTIAESHVASWAGASSAITGHVFLGVLSVPCKFTNRSSEFGPLVSVPEGFSNNFRCYWGVLPKPELWAFFLLSSRTGLQIPGLEFGSRGFSNNFRRYCMGIISVGPLSCTAASKYSLHCTKCTPSLDRSCRGDCQPWPDNRRSRQPQLPRTEPEGWGSRTTTLWLKHWLPLSRRNISLLIPAKGT